MNKAELISAIADNSGLSKVDSKKALDGFIAAVSNALKSGDKVALVGFGKMVSFCNAQDFLDYYETLEDPSPEIKRLATNLSPDSNPIIVIANLKKK